MSFQLLSQSVIAERFINIKNPDQLIDGTLGTNSSNLCKQCKTNQEDCLGHPGYIKLSDRIINPCAINKVLETLIKTCWGCGRDTSNLFLGFQPHNFISSVKEFIKRHDLKCTSCSRNVCTSVIWNSENNTFESVDVDVNTKYQLSLSDIPERLEMYVMKNIPVFPIYNNDISNMKSRKLISSLSSLFNPNNNAYSIYSTIIGSEKRSNYLSIKKMISSKDGLVEQNILGKRVNYCMRSVIVPNASLDVDQVLVPRDAIDVLDVKEGQLVLFNRQPSLVRQSILALKVKVRDDDEKVLAFNPCLCGAFNADFDGDEMNLFVTGEDDELKHMIPQNNVLGLRSGRPVIYPHQDCLLGLSYCPEFKEDTKARVLNYIMNINDRREINVIFKNMQLQAYNNLDKEKFTLYSFKNSIKRIIQSGARGSDSNWRYMFEELGRQNISSTTKRQSNNTVINNNLEKGLTFDEYFIHSQATRESICSTGVTTAASGYISKRLSRLLGDMKTDC